jgi:hypothetical protein
MGYHIPAFSLWQLSSIAGYVMPLFNSCFSAVQAKKINAEINNQYRKSSYP